MPCTVRTPGLAAFVVAMAKMPSARRSTKDPPHAAAHFRYGTWTFTSTTNSPGFASRSHCPAVGPVTSRFPSAPATVVQPTPSTP